eukprot:6180101-Prymnesium_polylepis.1
MVSMALGRPEARRHAATSFATPEPANESARPADVKTAQTRARPQCAAPSTNWRGPERARREIRQNAKGRPPLRGQAGLVSRNGR